MNWQLEPLGLTMRDLRAQPLGLRAPACERQYERYAETFTAQSSRLDGGPWLEQGKVALYNTLFEAAGFSPLPEWREPAESLTGTPDLAQSRPFILSDYHTTRCFSAGWQRNVPDLRRLMPFPIFTFLILSILLWISLRFRAMCMLS